MKFINFVRYRDLDRIADARPAHFAYADRLRAQGELAIGGPLLDDKGRRIGLLFVYEAVSRDAALAFAQEDPFTLANALSGYEITEWRLRGVNLDLLIRANRSADQSRGTNTQIRLFANYAKYGGGKSRLETVRPAHWEYDRALKSAGKLALAGPFANDVGGLFVYNAAHREEAMSYRKQDPFAVEGVFADYELLEWLIEGVNPDLLASDFSSERSESAIPERKRLKQTNSADKSSKTKGRKQLRRRQQPERQKTKKRPVRCAKDHQVTAAVRYVANPDLTVAETRRLEKIGDAADELLDKVGQLRRPIVARGRGREMDPEP